MVDGVNLNGSMYASTTAPKTTTEKKAVKENEDGNTGTSKNSWSTVHTGNGATDKGTKIVKKGKEMDKNAFFRILSAQLANQDPSNPLDSSQFVAQLAQFSSLEQMTNLNSTMTFSSAKELVGKTVAFNSYNYKGEQYGGVVTSVTKKGDEPIVSVMVKENGKIVEKNFNYSEVSEVIEVGNNYLDNLNYNMDFLVSSSFIGKEVKASDENGVYEGVVKSVYKDRIGVTVVIDTHGKLTTEEMKKDEGVSDQNVIVNGVYEGNENKKLLVRYNKYAGEDQCKYQYKFVGKNDVEEAVQWKDYTKEDKVEGIKLILPEKEPESEVRWSYEFETYENKEIHFPSTNVLEVSEVKEV